MPRIYDFNDFIKHLYGQKNSVFTCVTGPNGSGKTEFNLLQLERIHELGLGVRYGSNMPIPEHLKPDFEMDFIEDFETLEKICQMLNPPNTRTIKKYFFFLSELGKFVPKDEAWKKDNIKFIQKLQTPRKIGLNMLTDAIDRVDGRVLSPMFFNGEFKKPYSDNPKYAKYKDYRSGRTFTFKDIPKCKMWFDTYYSANFYIDKQTDENKIVILNPEHELIREYLKTESWRKAGIETKKGKRAVLAVLKYHMAHCLNSGHEQEQPLPEVESNPA
jgi:hypothetical protein